MSSRNAGDCGAAGVQNYDLFDQRCSSRPCVMISSDGSVLSLFLCWDIWKYVEWNTGLVDHQLFTKIVFDKSSLVVFNSNYPAPNIAAGAYIYLEMLSAKILDGMFLKPWPLTSVFQVHLITQTASRVY